MHKWAFSFWLLTAEYCITLCNYIFYEIMDFPFSEIFLTFFAYSTEISTQCRLICFTFESKTNRSGSEFFTIFQWVFFIKSFFFCAIESRWIKLKHLKLKVAQFVFAVFLLMREKVELKMFSTWNALRDENWSGIFLFNIEEIEKKSADLFPFSSHFNVKWKTFSCTLSLFRRRSDFSPSK